VLAHVELALAHARPAPRRGARTTGIEPERVALATRA